MVRFTVFTFQNITLVKVKRNALEFGCVSAFGSSGQCVFQAQELSEFINQFSSTLRKGFGF